MISDIEDFIVKQVKLEVNTASSNQTLDNADFEAVIDLLECKRNEKNYDWMSNVSYPEYAACILTESSQWANQYFASREYVDVYLEGDAPDDKDKCALVKKLINKTLNRRELYHYHKYMRARTVNSTAGVCYAICGWDQVLQDTVIGMKKVPDGGMQMLESGISIPTFKEEEVTEPQPLKDCFEYDVVDPRNVFTDNTYSYSVQDKAWITIRSEESYETLKMNEESHGYVNLDKVKEFLKDSTTETATSKESYNKDDKKQPIQKPVIKLGDVLTRYGKMWAIVTDKDEFGNATKIKYGIDDLGEIRDKAELVEAITTVFVYGGKSVLIRFQATPFIDSFGNPYKPIIRGLCYIHPTKDTGMSDGKYARESQVALDDTINISNDRVKLATIPTFIVDKYACEDNDEIYIEPEHIIPIEGGVGNLQELKIRDNIQGAMQQANMFIDAIHKVTSIYEPTMGAGVAPSTTATAISDSGQRSNMRSNYKALTFEYTFLTDLYWMILQMSHRFMHPYTALKLLGQKGVMLFDPSSDYTYQPITSNIEQEHGKIKKLSLIDQALGRLVNVPNPKTPMLINKLMVMYFDLLGKEYQDIQDSLLDEGESGQQMAMNPKGQSQGSGAPVDMVSNQNGVPVSTNEMMVR